MDSVLSLHTTLPPLETKEWIVSRSITQSHEWLWLDQCQPSRTQNGRGRKLCRHRQSSLGFTSFQRNGTGSGLNLLHSANPTRRLWRFGGPVIPHARRPRLCQ
ncbi:hypothetical protein J3F84DRAFT_365216 [Trichoderma pleuroticola]